MKFNFAELNKTQLTFIENIEIGEMFISDEHCRLVSKVLELDGKSETELRGIRNTVVRHLGDKFEEVKADYEKGCRCLTNMSGITCVIDTKLMNLGCEV